jgi:hypothetical protein
MTDLFDSLKNNPYKQFKSSLIKKNKIQNDIPV